MFSFNNPTKEKNATGRRPLFSFSNPTKEEKRLSEQTEKEIKEATAQAEERLIACLQSDNFAKYTQELEETDKRLIRIGIEIMSKIKDPNNRVRAYDALFVRAEVLGLLLKGIENDRKKHNI